MQLPTEALIATFGGIICSLSPLLQYPGFLDCFDVAATGAASKQLKVTTTHT